MSLGIVNSLPTAVYGMHTEPTPFDTGSDEADHLVATSYRAAFVASHDQCAEKVATARNKTFVYPLFVNKIGENQNKHRTTQWFFQQRTSRHINAQRRLLKVDTPISGIAAS